MGKSVKGKPSNMTGLNKGTSAKLPAELYPSGGPGKAAPSSLPGQVYPSGTGAAKAAPKKGAGRRSGKSGK
jgi:hypothetical protein